MKVIPGLVDIHFHGAKNCDFCDGSIEALKTIAEYELSQGVLAICPTSMTIPKEDIKRVLENATEFKAMDYKYGSSLIGINLEGPFISPKKVGAQNPENVVAANLGLFNEFQEKAKGIIKLVDIAPEEAGNLEFIRDLKQSTSDSDIHVSIAHSNCDYDTAKMAFEYGADHMTHLWNAMNGIHHRNPGPSLAGAESGAFAEIICDGIHIHPAMIRLAFKMFGEDKICLISDSMRATGMPDGEYDLGGQRVLVQGKKAVLKDNADALAGSVSNLYECMKNAVSFGISLETAVRAASENPAKSIGIDSEYGIIDEGKFANLLVLDDDLNLEKIINKGRFV